MSTLNTCAPVVVATHHSWLERAWHHAVQATVNAYVAWGERARARANWRAMQGLSDQTLRDIGWAERLPLRPTLGTLDYERSRWQ
jgi:uncharacterized protein YjiS (DUF1127 family)